MSRGRHANPPVRLTHRGRVARDLTAGGLCLAVAIFAHPVSIAFFTVVSVAARCLRAV